MQVTPEKRGQAKQMAYGLLYGIGMHALAKSMEVTPDQAQQLSDSFRRRIPTLVCPSMMLADAFSLLLLLSKKLFALLTTETFP